MSPSRPPEQLEAIAYHGWGFDHTCWQPWHDWLNAWNCSLQCFDRGYFGQPMAPHFSPTATVKLVLVHSYGLHLCPADQICQADWLLIFSSFRGFHPSQHRARRRSHVVLAQMIHQLRSHPQQVLQMFKTNCYYPQPWLSSAAHSSPDTTDTDYPTNPVDPRLHYELDGDRLLADLQALDRAILDSLPLSTTANIIVFHGSGDRIVAPERSLDLMACLSSISQSVVIPNAGHALPFTHYLACWAVLDPLFSRQFHRQCNEHCDQL